VILKLELKNMNLNVCFYENLTGADLTGADLRSTRWLSNVNIDGVNLNRVKVRSHSIDPNAVYQYQSSYQLINSYAKRLDLKMARYLTLNDESRLDLIATAINCLKGECSTKYFAFLRSEKNCYSPLVLEVLGILRANANNPDVEKVMGLVLTKLKELGIEHSTEHIELLYALIFTGKLLGSEGKSFVGELEQFKASLDKGENIPATKPFLAPTQLPTQALSSLSASASAQPPTATALPAPTATVSDQPPAPTTTEQTL
jgi:hypothetical protein